MKPCQWAPVTKEVSMANDLVGGAVEAVLDAVVDKTFNR